MDRTSKVIIFLSQLAAFSIVLTFIIGMRWQTGFYDGLGFPWLSGYSNYLDTIKFGIPHTLTLALSSAVGWYVTWVLYHRNKELLPFLLLITICLISVSQLFASFFYDVASSDFLHLESYYQLVLTGFCIGCVLCAPLRLENITERNEPKLITRFQLMVLLFLTIVMIAFFASPYKLGKAAAQEAIKTGFKGYSLAYDNKSEYWSIVGHSQGNLILARILNSKNQVQVKISNNISDWIIYSTIPQATGITSTP